MCIYPVLLRHKLTQRLFKVPCGVCEECKRARAKMWSIRLEHEHKYWNDSVFITLTYDDEHLPTDNSLHKEHTQAFMKRLRKALDGRKIKYFLCGEYGDQFGRPHYHAIVFGVSELEDDIIRKCWILGFIKVGEVTKASCKYVAGYVQKKMYGISAKEYEEKGQEPPFILMSRRPGIAEEFVQDYREYLTSHDFLRENGYKVAMPRYYEEKVHPRDTDYQHYIDKAKKIVDLEKKHLDDLKGKGYSEWEERDQRELNILAKRSLSKRK